MAFDDLHRSWPAGARPPKPTRLVLDSLIPQPQLCTLLIRRFATYVVLMCHNLNLMNNTSNVHRNTKVSTSTTTTNSTATTTSIEELEFRQEPAEEDTIVISLEEADSIVIGHKVMEPTSIVTSSSTANVMGLDEADSIEIGPKEKLIRYKKFGAVSHPHPDDIVYARDTALRACSELTCMEAVVIDIVEALRGTPREHVDKIVSSHT